MDERPACLERLRGTVGLWSVTNDWVAPSEVGDLAREVESLGYGAFWLHEAWGREAVSSAGLLLAATSRLVVATGIASIYARDAVASVNAARALSAAYDDRFVLGLGVSHRPARRTPPRATRTRRRSPRCATTSTPWTPRRCSPPRPASPTRASWRRSARACSSSARHAPTAFSPTW